MSAPAFYWCCDWGCRAPAPGWVSAANPSVRLPYRPPRSTCGQADAQKAQPALPVRIHLTPEARQADRLPASTAMATSNSSRAIRCGSLDCCMPGGTPRILIPEQLLAAKELLVAPDQIEIGSIVLIRNQGSSTGIRWDGRSPGSRSGCHRPRGAHN